LNPDCFVGFGAHNALNDQREIREAATFLRTKIIPETVQYIQNKYVTLDSLCLFVCLFLFDITFFLQSFSAPFSIDSVLFELHSKGVNYRMMGYIRSYVTDATLSLLLLEEMIVRVMKFHLRSLFRYLDQRNGKRNCVAKGNSKIYFVGLNRHERCLWIHTRKCFWIF
jgi:hypothetical protein